MTIGDNLRQLRLDRGMTQEQTAEKLGVTRQAVSSYESGRTRPDIDTLMRLSQIYGTDLEGLLYGQTRTLKWTKRVAVTAVVLLVLLVILTVVSGAFAYSANMILGDIPKSEQLTQAQMAQVEASLRLDDIWETIDRIILTVSTLGFGLLLILIVAGNCSLPLKHKLLYAAALGAGLLLVAVVFAIADPVFGMVDYILIPGLVIFRMLLFLAAELLITYVKQRKKAR